MKKSLFIGIDFSKEKIDVSFLSLYAISEINHQVFDNSLSGFKSMITWMKSNTNIPAKEWLFCGEHTGLYSVELVSFLNQKELDIWMENPLQIKLSMGIRREKNDKIDSEEIALYAYRYRDKAQSYKLPDQSFIQLRDLMAFRDRLVKNKNIVMVAAKENRKVKKGDPTAEWIYEKSKKQYDDIEQDIDEVERKMLEIILSNEALSENYKLITSIKGIGMINTVALMVHTLNFTGFSTARELACYCGVVPFEKRKSGTSIKSRPEISNMANKKLKTLLTQAARSAVRHDEGLKAYYNGKISQGKHQNVALNNVRNKLVHVIFAVAIKKQKYDPCYINKLKQSA